MDRGKNVHILHGQEKTQTMMGIAPKGNVLKLNET